MDTNYLLEQSRVITRDRTRDIQLPKRMHCGIPRIIGQPQYLVRARARLDTATPQLRQVFLAETGLLDRVAMREPVGIQIVQGPLQVALARLLLIVKSGLVIDALAAVEDPLQLGVLVIFPELGKLGPEFFEGAALKLGADEVEALRGVSSIPLMG